MNLPLDILFEIFGLLSPKERFKIKTVSKSFYKIHLKHVLQRNNLDPNKYILYRRSKNIKSDNLIYNIVRTDINYIYLKTKRTKKETKVKKLYNKYGVIYCKFQNNYLYIHEKEYIKNIEKDNYEKCKELYFLKDCSFFKEVCPFKNCKKLKVYKKLKNIDNKLTKNFDNYCEHRLCQ
ncbi:4323_t:CDS:1 [Scutellospora calospora]|uniref:4323_t:CDS:1 n=1 Tax=Scutellospora calospora TaxID=85575 RepID=A0ACA9N379_9GLOM|nr:4323_t:CDS:1 [Scutellospora calospora]